MLNIYTCQTKHAAWGLFRPHFRSNKLLVDVYVKFFFYIHDIVFENEHNYFNPRLVKDSET